MGKHGMPHQVRHREDGITTEAMQYVRYEAGHTNWDTIHGWTGGLINYLGGGVSVVSSRGGTRGVVKTEMTPGDPRWIVRVAPRRYTVMDASVFAETYEEASRG